MVEIELGEIAYEGLVLFGILSLKIDFIIAWNFKYRLLLSLRLVEIFTRTLARLHSGAHMSMLNVVLLTCLLHNLPIPCLMKVNCLYLDASSFTTHFSIPSIVHHWHFSSSCNSLGPTFPTVRCSLFIVHPEPLGLFKVQTTCSTFLFICFTVHGSGWRARPSSSKASRMSPTIATTQPSWPISKRLSRNISRPRKRRWRIRATQTWKVTRSCIRTSWSYSRGSSAQSTMTPSSTPRNGEWTDLLVNSMRDGLFLDRNSNAALKSWVLLVLVLALPVSSMGL